MLSKLNSNSFGSFEKHLIFSVPKQHAPLLEDAGWKVFQNSVIGTQFKFSFHNRGTGDDETVLFELMHALPETYEGNGLRVLWGRSEY
ncbi:MAG: hypothetical protein ABJG88_00285 [Litorimonas sp.]